MRQSLPGFTVRSQRLLRAGRTRRLVSLSARFQGGQQNRRLHLTVSGHPLRRQRPVRRFISHFPGRNFHHLRLSRRLQRQSVPRWRLRSGRLLCLSTLSGSPSLRLRTL